MILHSQNLMRYAVITNYYFVQDILKEIRLKRMYMIALR